MAVLFVAAGARPEPVPAVRLDRALDSRPPATARSKHRLGRKWVLGCCNILSLRGAERRSNLDRLSVVGARLPRFARNDRVCRIDRFIQGGSAARPVINSQ